MNCNSCRIKSWQHFRINDVHLTPTALLSSSISGIIYLDVICVCLFPRGWFWGFEETRARNVTCISAQGHASIMAPVLQKNITVTWVYMVASLKMSCAHLPNNDNLLHILDLKNKVTKVTFVVLSCNNDNNLWLPVPYFTALCTAVHNTFFDDGFHQTVEVMQECTKGQTACWSLSTAHTGWTGNTPSTDHQAIEGHTCNHSSLLHSHIIWNLKAARACFFLSPIRQNKWWTTRKNCILVIL